MGSIATPDVIWASSTERVIRFGLFELDVRTRELRKRGLKVHLPDQPFQVLLLLLERPGEVVTRQELRQRLWSDDTFVDFDLSLNSAVRKLRDALGDSAEHSTFIETLPKRGYRFIAPVERPPSDCVMPATERPADQVRPSQRWPRLAASLAIGCLALGGVFVWANARSLWSLPPTSAIAVLPLHNLTGDPGREDFLDGLTEALNTELTQVGSVDVISSTSSRLYKRSRKPLPEIGRELNADKVITGSATSSDGKVYVLVQLTDAATDRQLWAQPYEMNDAVALPAAIARAIAAVVGNRGAAAVSAPSSHPRAISAEAYDLYLAGLGARGRGSNDGFRMAAAYFKQAIAKQPDFAQAYASLAVTLFQFLWVGAPSPGEILPEVESAARTALTLDNTLEEALRALALCHRVYGDHASADAEIERLQKLAPHNVDVLRLSSLSLLRQKRFLEAVTAAERAQRIDPLNVTATVALARVLRATGNHTRAMEELRKAVQLNSEGGVPRFQLGVTYVLKGDIRTAIPHLEWAFAHASLRNPRVAAYLGYAYAMEGREQDARQLLRELLSRREHQYVSSFGIAFLYDALGDKARALAAIEQAWDEHAVEFTQLDSYPAFKALASEPRYVELIHLAAGKP